MDDSYHHLNVYNHLDFSNIIYLNQNNKLGGIIDYIKANNLNRDIQGHPNPKGYQFISDIIKSSL